MNAGSCGVEVNERADSEAKQSIKEGRDRQMLLLAADLKAQWEQKSREELHSLLKSPKGTEKEDILVGTTGMACSRGSVRSRRTVALSCHEGRILQSQGKAKWA
jgi:hypothetical protein